MALFRMILSSLRPGGHLLIGDHVGALGLAAHLKQLVGKRLPQIGNNRNLRLGKWSHNITTELPSLDLVWRISYFDANKS